MFRTAVGLLRPPSKLGHGRDAMPFMVIYRTADGSSKFEQADAIDEAALFVERLRNSDGTDEIRIYRMEEISFAFRPYYKVELGLPDRQTPAPPSDVIGGLNVVAEPVAPPPLPARPVAAAVAPAPEPVVEVEATLALDEPPALAEAATELPPPPGADALADGAGSNGARRGLFGR
jgi:hypothetical protein